MRIIMFIFYLLLIIFGVTFAALNASYVSVNFYFTSLKMPIAMLIVLMLGSGIVCGFLIFLGKYWRLKIEYRKVKNQLSLMEREIKNLRAIPLQPL